MKKQEIVKRMEIPVANIFDMQYKWTILAGAGISMDAPSNLPSARQITRSLLEFCAPEEEVEELANLEALRYELLVEMIQQVRDTELVFMDYFDQVKDPNLVHIFIAQAILTENYAITTNFDYLIEFALQALLSKEKHHNIHPIITKADFLQYKNPEELMAQGRFPLYKIHGAKSNIITHESTIDSLVTTISDLGKDREAGETFAIEPYKKPAVNNMMRDRSLLIMGYSGSDDFDIGPVLKELPHLKQLVWIEHAPVDRPEIYQIQKIADLSTISSLSKPDSLLAEIRSDVDFEVFLIKTNTGTLIRDSLWSQFFPSIPLPKVASHPSQRPDFKTWAQNIYANTGILDKYILASKIYLEVNQNQSTLRTAQKGLTLASKMEDQYEFMKKGNFNNILGHVYKDIGEPEKALEAYSANLETDLKLGDVDGITAAYSGIGYIYYSQSNFQTALEYYNKALDLAIKNDLLEKQGHYLNSLGMIYKDQGKFDQAMNYLQKALTIAENVGNLTSKARLYSNIGQMHKSRMEYDRAIQYYQDAYKINSELGQIRSMAVRLGHIGQVYYMQEKFDLAKQHYEDSLKIYKELGDISSQARTMGNLALINVQNKEYDIALEIFKETVQIADKLGELRGKAIRLNNIGTIYQAQDEDEQALKYFFEAVDIDQSTGNQANLITDFNNIGLSYGKLKNYDQAFDYYNKTINIAKEIQQEEIRMIGLRNLRDLYVQRGDELKSERNYLQAIEDYQQAFELHNTLKNPEEKAYYLNKIGVANYYADQNETAMQYFEEAFRLDEQFDDRKGKSDRLYYMALIYQEAQNLEKAVDLFTESLKYADELALVDDQLLLLEKIYKIYQELALPEKTVPFFDRYLTLHSHIYAENAEELQESVIKYLELAKLSNSLKMHEEAYEILLRGAKIAEQTQMFYELCAIYYTAGYTQSQNLKNYSKANKLYKQADQIASSHHFVDLQNQLLNQWALSLKYLGQFDEAINKLLLAIPLSEKLADPNALGHRYNNLAGIYFRKKAYQQSLEYYTLALTQFSALGKTKSVATIQKNIENVQKRI
ncbi:tetratricopeptide repeat protein [Candidatus Lokiarchaeum ossiferum]|uniref:tetratricopeptide repeat protein n=1 Tax=Candidatus Lokiarchaeum ossiferum TaxID=2951803 RepID=UPI00352F606D